MGAFVTEVLSRAKARVWLAQLPQVVKIIGLKYCLAAQTSPAEHKSSFISHIAYEVGLQRVVGKLAQPLMPWQPWYADKFTW